jgi:hypothetical protein
MVVPGCKGDDALQKICIAANSGGAKAGFLAIGRRLAPPHA